ncbi:adenylate/guanylate cyclase domain-containing protein [Polaromonas sp. AET17H-212]|uniref:adenylate/guanylate cyclase domain-containing protein n=1 Tax=Polaromonas sp. AET17H-212 TaxID=1977061 RepID=UPI001596FBC8|nr:adenylate/guanylate cyclase domain-containing protein [Polaromonas sp. AET17H-212]
MIELPANMTRSTKVLLVMDVVESVRIMEQDQDGFVRRWQQLVEEAEQNVLPLHGGRIVKSLGDGLMLEFANAQSCVKAAFALHQFARQANAGVPPDHQMHLRMGGHLASFVTDQHDIYGTDVNLTSRVSTLAGPGEIVVTAELRDHLIVDVDVDIEDLGECHLKHVQNTVRAYRAGPAGHASVVIPIREYTAPIQPTVAVIPFEAHNSELSQFSVGALLADSVIGQLCRTADLRVISRLSSSVFCGRNASLSDIETHLGATFVLSGSYVAQGNKLLISAELADARAAQVIWADRINGDVSDLLRVESEISHSIAAAVYSAILKTEVKKALTKPLPTLESHSAMLGAVTLMHRTTRDDFFKAHKLLELLIERHQRHPVLWAWMSKWHVLQVEQGWSANPEDTAKLALSQSSRALDMDSTSSMALSIDGFVRCNLLKDFDGALQKYRAAIDANPSESLAWLFMGMLYGFTGKDHLALEAIEKAIALSPLDPAKYFYQSLAASVNLSAGNYLRAIELAQTSLRSNTTHVSTHRALIIAQAMSGQIEQAKTQTTKLLALDPGFTISKFLARKSGAQFDEKAKTFAEALRMAGVPT